MRTLKVAAAIPVLLLPLWQAAASPPKQAPELVGMVQLLANAERFSGKRVTVIGYLFISNHGVNAGATLCLHREDWSNELDNCVSVLPSAEMHRDWRELTGTYVRLTGTVASSNPGPPEGRSTQIHDITECDVWSDPKRPRALNHIPYVLTHPPDAPRK